MGKGRMVGIGGVLGVAVVIGIWGQEGKQAWEEWVCPQKYSETTQLRTTSPRYTFTPDHGLSEQYIPCDHDCPWESSLPNSEFKARTPFRAAFQAIDDQGLFALRKELACVPFSFGYSEKRGMEMFPPHEYPSCESRLTAPVPQLDLYSNSSMFSMSCDNQTSPKYVLHPPNLSQQAHLLYSDIKNQFQEQTYQGETLSGGSEYAFGSCNHDIFTNAQYIPVFNATAYARAKAIMTDRGGNRPVLVLFLTVDSFSRRHFYRKMPKTVGFLNELNANGAYSVFDFKLHNIVGSASVENMVPMFSNRSLHRSKSPPYADMLGDSSLWSVYSSLGFVTLLGFEDCDYYFVNYLGRRINADHVIRSFYCGVEKYFHVVMDKNAKTQRCVGPRMSHYYALNYSKTVAEMYEGVNLFTYLHINTGHEASGQHAGLLDSDLTEFVQAYLRDFGGNNDVFVFIQGDHGMRYGDWERDKDAEQEHKLPVLFLIAPTQYLDGEQHSYDTLWHNTKRLVSKRDLRATLLALATAGYREQYPVHGETYLAQAKVLFREKIEDSRTCQSIGINPWKCSCLFAFEEIPGEIVHSWGIGPVERLLLRVVDIALTHLNGIYHTPTAVPSGVLCERLTFDGIIHAYGAAISPKTEEIEVVFSIKESQSARIQLYALVGSARNNEYINKPENWIPLDSYEYNEFPVVIRVRNRQLVSVSRKDSYAGPCESVSRANGVDAEFCICRDLDELRRNFPSIYYR